jgi:copper(I)-binding protein
MIGSKWIAGLAVAALAAGGLAACGDDNDAAGGLEITGAWARTSPAMVQAGAAYMTISSGEAVSIVSARVEADVAGVAELHEVVPVDGGDMGGDEAAEGESEPMEDEAMEGMEGEMAMTMQEVTSIDIPAGGTVALEPGGYHVMLLDLPDPLETGEEFDVTLVLGDGTEVIVPITVSESAPE